MARLLFGHDEELAKWAETNFPDLAGFSRPLVSIGIARGDRLLAVAVYNQYLGHDIRFSLGALTPKWASRGTIRALLDYPFHQLGVKRMTSITAKDNKPARRILEGTGFKMEGVHPYGEDGRRTAISYGIYHNSPKLKKWFE